jgi:AcrR family transcriptional regulator
MKTKKTPKREYNPLVDGVNTDFIERGYPSANMRSIGDSSNITTSNMYRYFQNKESSIHSANESIVNRKGTPTKKLK